MLRYVKFDAQHCTAAFRCVIAAPVAERMLPGQAAFHNLLLTQISCYLRAASYAMAASVWCNRNKTACSLYQSEAIIICPSVLHNSFIKDALPASFAMSA